MQKVAAFHVSPGQVNFIKRQRNQAGNTSRHSTHAHSTTTTNNTATDDDDDAAAATNTVSMPAAVHTGRKQHARCATLVAQAALLVGIAVGQRH